MTKHQKFLQELNLRIDTCNKTVAMINSGKLITKTKASEAKLLIQTRTGLNTYTEMRTVFIALFRDELEVTSQSEVL